MKRIYTIIHNSHILAIMDFLYWIDKGYLCIEHNWSNLVKICRYWLQIKIAVFLSRSISRIGTTHIYGLHVFLILYFSHIGLT